MGGQVSGGMGTRGDDVSRLDGEEVQQCFCHGVKQARRMVRMVVTVAEFLLAAAAVVFRSSDMSRSGQTLVNLGCPRVVSWTEAGSYGTGACRRLASPRDLSRLQRPLPCDGTGRLPSYVCEADATQEAQC